MSCVKLWDMVLKLSLIQTSAFGVVVVIVSMGILRKVRVDFL
jgi:hypothetical protein